MALRKQRLVWANKTLKFADCIVDLSFPTIDEDSSSLHAPETETEAPVPRTIERDDDQDSDDGEGEDAFGDDFDDFEEGNEDDEDFDDFEDGFHQPDASQQQQYPPSLQTTLPFVRITTSFCKPQN